jgi:dynein heavy chain
MFGVSCCNLQGMQSLGVPVQDGKGLVRLWAHEAMRVFHDRLVDDPDRGWFCALLAGMLPKHMGSAFEDVLATEPEQPASPAVAARGAAGGADGIADAARAAEQKAAAAALRNVLFADFLQPGSGGAETAKYQEAGEVGKLLKRVEDSLADYNEQVGVGHVCLFAALPTGLGILQVFLRLCTTMSTCLL